jgi:hypothetical protein
MPHGLERLHDGTHLAVKVAKLDSRSGIWLAAWMKEEMGREGGIDPSRRQVSLSFSFLSFSLFLFLFILKFSNSNWAPVSYLIFKIKSTIKNQHVMQYSFYFIYLFIILHNSYFWTCFAPNNYFEKNIFFDCIISIKRCSNIYPHIILIDLNKG